MLIEITYNVTDVYMSTTETPVYVEISFEQPGSASAVWGSITGTLSNQTDLQNALNLKVPYTGATTNVNLGEYELKAGQVTLDTSPTGTAAVGTIRWNDTTGTSETTLKGGNVIIKNGVDLVARVVNKVSPNTTLTKAAYQAVRVSGAQGQRLAVALAQANNDANSADTIGLVTETIATNQEGFIMTVGQLEGINTTGSLQGETWVDGDVLYLSPTTAGAITNVKPTGATGHLVIIGYVEYAHANNGKLYIKVANGFEIDELHNVSIVTPTNNQGLFYNSSNSLWENKTISTALGYTPVPTTRNITINGVTYDLSADRTWTISTGISGSGAAGQVTYWDGTSSVSGSNNFTWDNAVGLLTVKSENSAAPVRGILNEQYNNGVQAAAMVFRKARGTIASPANVLASDLVGAFSFSARVGGAFTSDRALFGANMATSTGIGMYFIAGSTDGDYAPDLYIHPTGNVVVNGGGTIITGGVTDGGQKFQVYGDTLLRGSGNTSATTALTVQNSSSTNLLRVLNNGNVSFGADAMFWDNANGRLGIGTNAPEFITDIKSAAFPYLQIQSTTDTQSSNGRAGIRLARGSSSTLTGVDFVKNDLDNLEIRRVTVGSATTWLTLFRSTGNLVLQNGGTFTDGGQRLQVIGDTLLRGSGATSATTALTVQNSSSTNLLLLNNAGNLGLGVTPSAWATTNLVKAIQLNSGSLWNFQSSRLYLAQNLFFNGTDNIYYSTGEASSYEQSTGRHIWYTAASGTGGATLTLNQRMTLDINGLLGIGQNTPTALADIGASTTTRASLRIRSGTAPTTPNDGDIWFDGTDIKMRIGGVTKTFTLL